MTVGYQPVLIGDDFDENPIPHAGMANAGFDMLDLHASFESFRVT